MKNIESMGFEQETPKGEHSNKKNMKRAITQVGSICAMVGATSACSESGEDPQKEALKNMRADSGPRVEHFDASKRFVASALRSMLSIKDVDKSASKLRRNMAPEAHKQMVDSIVTDLAAQLKTGEDDYGSVNIDNADYLRALSLLKMELYTMSDQELRAPGIQALLRLMRQSGVVSTEEMANPPQTEGKGKVRMSGEFADEF